MNRRGHAGKVDGNHELIAGAFRAAGCAVQSLAPVGSGCPDLLVGIVGHNVLIEVKDPAQPPSKRAFSPDQKRWHAAWTGTAHVVETIDQVVLIIGMYHAHRRVAPLSERALEGA